MLLPFPRTRCQPSRSTLTLLRAIRVACLAMSSINRLNLASCSCVRTFTWSDGVDVFVIGVIPSKKVSCLASEIVAKAKNLGYIQGFWLWLLQVEWVINELLFCNLIIYLIEKLVNTKI